MSRGKVQILMSTYNGEMFLEKQLDSILAQKYPIELLIRPSVTTVCGTDRSL